ncbi:MAG: hypothetical protein Q9208_007507 [Pyrenodesmia sp. 3 TL-2023]
MSKNQAQQVEDKAGEPIKEGDEVWTKMRGGKHEGESESLISRDILNNIVFLN